MSGPTNRRGFLGMLGAAGAAATSMGSGRLGAREVDGGHEAAAGSLRIALLQMAPEGSNAERHLAKADAFCRRAAAAGADIALMPEMWNIGYLGFNDRDPETVRMWSKQAVSRDGAWVGHFRSLARELGMAIGVTYLEARDGGPRNSLSLVDRHGEIVLDYAKVHTCDFAFEAALTPGSGWTATDLDTAKGVVRVGAMICYDREFPESARSLMLKGVEVAIVPNACLLDDLRLAQFRVRAHENAMAVAMTNYASPFNNGRSVAYGAAGEPLVEAGGQEELVLADFDLANLRDYRSKTIWGDAWRRPDRYKTLCEPDRLPVFRRTTFFGEPFRADASE